MRKLNYWLVAAMICGSAVLTTSCDKDDDNDNNNGGTTQTTTVSKPVQGTDFTVTVDGTTVTVTTSLTYGNMYVLYQGTQYAIKDGKATVSIPVAGDYKMTFNIYENGVNTASDEFSVTITATDLSFLDNSVTLKVLTGGKSVYEAGTNDGKGVFTRTWRLDWFKNNSGVNYSKSGFGAGLYYYGYMNTGKTIAVSAGRGTYQYQSDVEHATISFDFVKQVAKLVIEGDDFLGGNGDVIPSGTYYASFQYTKKEQNLFDGVNTCDWDGVDKSTSFGEDNLTNFGDEYTGEYYEITLDKVAIGESGIVRLPVDNFYNSNKENNGGSTQYYSFRDQDRLNFDIFVTNDAVMYAHMHRDNNNTGVSEEKGFEIIYTFVSDELDEAKAYTYEVPAEIKAGVWESNIRFWGNNDYNWEGEGMSSPVVEVKDDGDYTYKMTIGSDGEVQCLCVHFSAPTSYNELNEKLSATVTSIKLNGNDVECDFSKVAVENGDGAGNYRLRFMNLWNTDFEQAIASPLSLKKDDVLEISVTYSGL
jgi:hypothetical protein